MDKKYLMNGLAALAIVAGISSCVKDVDGVNTADQEKAAKENAELQLGLTIPEGQTWDMASQIEANVAVNLEAGESYEVAVYANDPIADGVGKVLAKGTVLGGKTYTTKFTGSKATTQLYVGVTDKNDYTRYKLASVKDGQLVADFGVSGAAARSMRAVTINGDTYDAFNMPTTAELNAAFPTSIPEGADEVVDLPTMEKYNTQYYNYNNLYWIYLRNGANHNYKVTKTGEAEIGGTYNNTNVGAYNVYVSVNGNVTLKRNGTELMNLYILNGNVTLDSNFGECGGVISVASGATLNDARDHVAHNSGIKVFNRGTYNATNYKFDIGNKASFYNEGSFTSTNALSYSAGSSNTSYFYNMGDAAELTAPSMTLNSTCNFISGGTVNISGETKVTQSGIVWVNNGHYTTGKLIFSAQNATFYNYCQLKVTDTTIFTDGQFNLMTGSYTETNKALFNNFHVNMYDNSGIYVKSGSKWGRQGAGIYQGFRAVNDNAQAYVRLGGMAYVPSHKGGAIHFEGKKLTYAIENVTFYDNCNGFDQYSTFDNINYWTETSAEKLAADKSENITFDTNDTAERANYSEMTFSEPAEGECSATWGEDGDEKIEEPAPVTFAFEDQISNGDYDLNDVVLKVTPHVVKSGKKITSIDYDNLDIKLVAAGATFDITVMVDKSALSFNGNTEVHDAFGVNRGVMVNTGGTAKSGVQQNAAPVTCTIATPAAVKGTDADGNPTLDLSQLDIWIDVNPGKKSAAQIKYLTEKTEPYAVMIPMDWAWPKERVCIKDAYLGSAEAEDVAIDESGNTFKKNSFAVWAATLDRDAVMNGWYNFPVEGSTMKNK